MSDKHNKPTLLVNQDEALGFYLDSLLSTHDHEEEIEAEDIQADTGNAQDHPVTDTRVTEAHKAAERQTDEAHASETAVDKLQRAKEFLQASKQRQQSHQTSPVIPEPAVKTDKVTLQPEQGEVLQETSLSEPLLTETMRKTAAKVITKGPVSPKPRESRKPDITRKQAIGTSIVFSETDKKGNVKEQVLIPRSQRLAAGGKSGQGLSKVEAKTMAATDAMQTSKAPGLESEKAINAAKTQALKETQTSNRAEQSIESLQPDKSPQPENNTQAITSPQVEEAKEIKTAKEAPNLDLSLFLPKIKTLSEEEIAHQIDALTQAAVSQAQLETDLAQVSQLEQRNKQLLEAQTEKDADALIRNVDNAPAWAVPDFQVLLFAVAGLKLAVPLTELNGIVEWGDEYITEMPGHAPWYLGLIQNQGINVPVIDTLQQVVPKNRWPSEYLEQRQFKHIILIDNGRWGLACERVLEVITLKTDSVKWRSSRTKRRWLMGTVIEHMCALLDSAEFATMLKTGEDSLNG